MGEFCIDIENIVDTSMDIMNLAVRMRELNDRLENVKTDKNLDGHTLAVEQSIKKILESVSDETAKMESLGEALKVIANKYREAENTIEGMRTKDFLSEQFTEKSSDVGSDKRSWWDKFWDWITRKEPDEYDTTKSEQEKAADAAMKRELRNVLQDEKYSQDNWDNASLDEQKKFFRIIWMK